MTLLNLHLSEAWDQEETKMAPGKWRALQTPKHPQWLHARYHLGCSWRTGNVLIQQRELAGQV